MVLCQPARIVMAKIQETTVWTETAMGMMRTIMMLVARVSRRRCSGVSFQPSESRA